MWSPGGVTNSCLVTWKYARDGLEGLAALCRVKMMIQSIVCNILLRDLALPVAEPIDLARAYLPLVIDEKLKLGLGQAWGQAAQDELQTWLRSLGTAGRLSSRISLQDGDRQDAVDTGLRGHA